ncbi:hypothetical protein AVEN_97329-1 [Araneus ventricosus]|uniref:Endonuclease/exonuclease/phosphatase domain-containing protein n=1 Tax=Araneus ventricosus TaxID=182803 RepID=A0A4Y2N2H0_ARAVE|nr:hypothetical protein AVEN_97329-1 [Araneus ventricosus]
MPGTAIDSVFHQNVRRRRTKTVDFLTSFASEDFVVICLTETWLCEQIDSSDLFDDRYLVFRKDRDSSTSSCKRGGGVIVAIKKNISASQIHVPLIDLECIRISVKLKFGKKLLLCVLYLPPASGIDRSLRTSAKFCIKRDYGNYLHLVEKDLISQSKKFWPHFKKDKNNNHLPDKLYYNDKCFTNDIDIANAYADYFYSAFKPSYEYDSNDAVDFNGFGDFVGIDTITYRVSNKGLPHFKIK